MFYKKVRVAYIRVYLWDVSPKSYACRTARAALGEPRAVRGAWISPYHWRMNRDHEEHLLAFGASQRHDFDVDAWVQLAKSGLVSRDEVVATALFLAGGYWYGHEDGLFRVAEELSPGSVGHFAERARAAEFNCSRFDSMLKTRIAHESRHP